MDDRAQSIGIARMLIAITLIGSICTFIAGQLAMPVLDRAHNATSNQTANQGTMWLKDAVGLIPLIILFIGFLSVIVLAVYRREVLR